MLISPETWKLAMFTGGTRSGKSRQAESFCYQNSSSRLYIATCQAWDDEMRDRINQHRKDRENDQWQTIEEPLDISQALLKADKTSEVILIECMSLWVNNLLFHDKNIESEAEKLIATIHQIQAKVVIVSNECGLGITPMNKLARQFIDHLGKINQRLAEEADYVVFVAAGLPLVLKNAV